MSVNKPSNYKKGLVVLGISLLLASVLISLCVLIGLSDLDNFAALGHSGLRSLSAIAILGCLLAAIGYHDD